MRKIFLSLIGAALLAGGCAAQLPEKLQSPNKSRDQAAPSLPNLPAKAVPKSEFKVKYDEFENQTTAAFEGVPGERGTLHWQATTQGRNLVDKSTKYMGAFETSGSTWSYLRCHRVVFLVDGERLVPNKAWHHGLVVRYGVLEFVHFSLTKDEAWKLAQGANVKGKVCETEFSVSLEDKEGLLKVLGSR